MGGSGKLIFIGLPGARGPIENLEKHYAGNDVSVFAFGEDLSCISASFIYSSAGVRGDEVACRSYDRNDREIFSVRADRNFLHRICAQVEI